MTTLTTHDNSVLKALFDPEGSLSGAVRIDAQSPSLPHFSESEFDTFRAEETFIIRPLKAASIEPRSVADVIKALSEMIQKSPRYASAYINRAQATRLQLAVGDIFTRNYAEASRQLLHDLGRGIDLATPSGSTQAASDHQAKVLAAGHTHRGLLLLKAAGMVRKGNAVEGIGGNLHTATADRIEEFASRDFAIGARYGNKMARQMSVKTNPYAKMCGAIVKEAMQKELAEATASRYGMIS